MSFHAFVFWTARHQIIASLFVDYLRSKKAHFKQ